MDSSEPPNRPHTQTLKRRRTDSVGSAITTASTSRSSTASYPSSRSRERHPADLSQEETHQSLLPIKGPEMPAELKVPEHKYSWARQDNRSPLARGRIIPKLVKQGIDDGILVGLSSNKLMDYICLICSMLYNTGVSARVPEWVPIQ